MELHDPSSQLTPVVKLIYLRRLRAAVMFHHESTKQACRARRDRGMGKAGTAIQFQRRELVAVPVLRIAREHSRDGHRSLTVAARIAVHSVPRLVYASKIMRFRFLFVCAGAAIALLAQQQYSPSLYNGMRWRQVCP